MHLRRRFTNPSVFSDPNRVIALTACAVTAPGDGCAVLVFRDITEFLVLCARAISHEEFVKTLVRWASQPAGASDVPEENRPTENVGESSFGKVTERFGRLSI